MSLLDDHRDDVRRSVIDELAQMHKDELDVRGNVLLCEAYREARDILRKEWFGKCSRVTNA